jgi:predicted enzyme related to lactoylglutathione lyase
VNPRGRLGHFELYSPDIDELRALYGNLFDWRIDTSNDYNYAIISSGAAHVSGGFGQSRDDSGLILYFFAPDMRHTLQLAEQAGAQVLDPMFSIETVTVARLCDTEGNRIGLWTTRQEIVVEDPALENLVIGFEISGDPVHLGSFYRWAFDWRVHADNGTVFTSDGTPQGRIVARGADYTSFVVRVPDIPAFETRAIGAGCKVVEGHEQWIDGNPMLHFADPWGIRFAVTASN